MKADCNKCKFSNISWGSHLSCKHPKAELLYFLKNTLNIKGNDHGIRNGWFMWPINFDTIWLENCDGFEEKSS